jgi:hypothetical protein
MHQVHVEMQVVRSDEPKAENLFRFDKVPEVSAGKVPASGASTRFFDRSFI